MTRAERLGPPASRGRGGRRPRARHDRRRAADGAGGGAARRAAAGRARAATRDGILAAARAPFAEPGYDRATIRGIAAHAGVDPALVLHYFGSKEALFGAALELPCEPGEVLARGLRRRARTSIGETVVRTFLEAWEPPESRVRLIAMLRSAMTNETAMGMVRDYLGREVFGPITAGARRARRASCAPPSSARSSSAWR